MIRRALIVLFVGIALSSCTQNDGYIGLLFGKWQLIEIWEDETMTQHDNLYYNFQTSVIMVQVVYRDGIENAAGLYYGNYERDGDELRFKIVEPSSDNSDIPSVLRLKKGEENMFHIEKLTSSKMILTRDKDGHFEKFVFRKF